VATPAEVMTSDGHTTLYGQPQYSQSPTDSMAFTNGTLRLGLWRQSTGMGS